MTHGVQLGGSTPLWFLRGRGEGAKAGEQRSFENPLPSAGISKLRTPVKGARNLIQVHGKGSAPDLSPLTPDKLQGVFERHNVYERSAAWFEGWATRLSLTHGAKLHTIDVANAQGDDLATRVLHIPATERPDNTLVMVCSTHGSEAEFGATAIEGFLRNHLPDLDRRRTQVVLVHGLNPWGWKHEFQFAEDNTDPNRSVKGPQAEPGPHYGIVRDWARAEGPPSPLFAGTVLETLEGVASGLVRSGFDASKLTRALAEGQDVDPAGFRFMGEGELPQVKALRNQILEPLLKDSKRVFFYDYHTGLMKSGVVHFMNMARARDEKSTDAILNDLEGPNLTRVGRNSGPYDTSGIDLTYIAHQAAPEGAQVHAATVEAGGFPPGFFPFGLDGDSQVALIATLVRQVERNQLHHFPEQVGPEKKAAILRRYRQLFNPDPKVNPKAVDWQRSVFEGAERLMRRTIQLCNMP